MNISSFFFFWTCNFKDVMRISETLKFTFDLGFYRWTEIQICIFFSLFIICCFKMNVYKLGDCEKRGDIRFIRNAEYEMKSFTFFFFLNKHIVYDPFDFFHPLLLLIQTILFFKQHLAKIVSQKSPLCTWW